MAAGRSAERSRSGLVMHIRIITFVGEPQQYFKEGRALRIETVINSPTDQGVLRRLEHLDQLQAKAREVNRPAAGL